MWYGNTWARKGKKATSQQLYELPFLYPRKISLWSETTDMARDGDVTIIQSKKNQVNGNIILDEVETDNVI